MALFKINRGNKQSLPATLKDGWAYLTLDDEKFYIDYVPNTGTPKRIEVNKDHLQEISLNNNTRVYLSGTVELPTGNTNVTTTGYVDSGVFLTTTPGELNATQYKISERAYMSYDSEDDAIGFTFL